MPASTEDRMNDQDRQAIEQLFGKLQKVEGRVSPRDPDAEALIRARMAEQPGAAYYLAQTVIMQELALAAANRRIEELEREAESGQAGGGFLGGLFGGGRQSGPSRQTETARRQPWSTPAQGQGGGFLAGAAQTAMGVAGGVLLGNMLAGALFGHGGAQAAGGGDNADDRDDGGSDNGADSSGNDGPGDIGGGDSAGGDFDVAGDF
jgi:hypothetical protein